MLLKSMLKLYLDTSVYCGYFDEEFEEITQTFFQRIFENEFKIITSNLTDQEMMNAPKRVIELYNSIQNPLIINVDNDKKVIDLAEKYIENKVVGLTSLTDCGHIAAASINNADILVSWNFKHIVNVVRIVGYNNINKMEGYKNLEIRSPREI